MTTNVLASLVSFALLLPLAANACKGMALAEVIFERNQVALPPSEQAKLSAALTTANRGVSYGKVMIAVAVHTPASEVPELSTRLALTRERELAIRNWLVAHGVHSDQVESTNARPYGPKTRTRARRAGSYELI
jgi:hypothetical protein